MSATPINAIFDYMALLISEREADEPFLLSQIQPALTFKFPGFSFATYGLNNLKDFLAMGEKAGYFKLVNTGDLKTMHLVAGSKRPQLVQAQNAVVDAGGGIGADDPRRNRWMTTLLESLLNADRADQILDIVRGSDVYNEAFDAFLASQEHTMPLYSVRGKVRRLRGFLKTVAERGETAAMTTWQTSRPVLHPPAVPPYREAPRYGGLISNLMGGDKRLDQVPPETFTALFFAVMNYYRREVARLKAWDWLTGLDLLEENIRAGFRPAGDTGTLKKGRFGVPAKPEPIGRTAPDEQAIAQLTQELQRQAGIRTTMDETAVWKAYLAAEGIKDSLQYLELHPDLVSKPNMLEWLDEHIKSAVLLRDPRLLRNLAEKAAIVLAAQQNGLATLHSSMLPIQDLTTAVLQNAELLGVILNYLGTETTEQAIRFLDAHPMLVQDPGIGDLLDDQAMRAAKAGDVAGYRRVTDRIDLWQHVGELGREDGIMQHQRYLSVPRDDKTVLTEMGLLLLRQASDVEARRDILETYPMVATEAGLAMISGTLDVLSFQRADEAEYERHHEVKRLIERCLQIGINRALAELK